MKNNIISVGLEKNYLLERLHIEIPVTCIDNMNDISNDKEGILIINLDNINSLY